jgi:hypothetical protein
VVYDPRQEPGAVAPHAGIRAGGGGKPPSLPRPSDGGGETEFKRDLPRVGAVSLTRIIHHEVTKDTNKLREQNSLYWIRYSQQGAHVAHLAEQNWHVFFVHFVP